MDFRTLADVPLFAPVDEWRRRLLWDHSIGRTHEGGSTVRVQGDQADHLLVLLSGSIVSSSTAPSGRTLRWGEFHACCVLDKIAVIDGRGHSGTFTASSRCVVRAIPRQRFLELVDDVAEVRRHVLRTLADQARGQQRRLLSITSPRTEDRLAAWLLEQAADRSHLVVTLPQRQQDLAEILGVTRVSVNRALVGLERQGLIRRNGDSVELLAPEPLALRAGS